MGKVTEFVDLAHMMLHLKETLEKLNASDDVQRKAISDCVEQLKVAALQISAVGVKLEVLERRVALVERHHELAPRAVITQQSPRKRLAKPSGPD
jgi:hypothetical protein